MQKVASFIFILVLCGCKSLAPDSYKNYLSDEPWKNIRLADSNEVPVVSDSMVIIRTNRAFLPGKAKFLADYIDHSGTARTFLIIAKNGRWMVHSIPDINTGMEISGKRQNIVVYVEGMGKNFFLATERALQMSSQYGVSVVMMDYPSINPLYGMNRNFRSSKENAYQTAPYLVHLLKEIDADKKAGREWTKVKRTLFMHSMGNIMLRKILMDRSDTAISHGLFNLIILNAACTDEKGHNLWIDNSKLGNNFVINYNKYDKQLNGAQMLLFKRQLGTKPQKPLAKKAFYIDFHQLVGSRHSNFVNIRFRAPVHTHASNYYTFILNGTFPDLNNTKLLLPARKGIGYYLK